LTAAAATKLEPLAALLASNPDYQIQIEASATARVTKSRYSNLHKNGRVLWLNGSRLPA